jgi:hypothetical protein
MQRLEQRSSRYDVTQFLASDLASCIQATCSCEASVLALPPGAQRDLDRAGGLTREFDLSARLWGTYLMEALRKRARPQLRDLRAGGFPGEKVEKRGQARDS